jgi:hypothetical protein
VLRTVPEWIKMKREVRYVLIFALTGLLVAGFVGYLSYKRLRGAAMKPCFLSLQGPVTEELEKEYSPQTRLNNDWVTLNADETYIVLSGALKSGKTDCGTIRSLQDGVDYWGNPVQIGFRRTDNLHFEVRIWSAGPDGKENTDDDVESGTGIG